MQNSTLVTVIVIALLVLGAGWYFFMNDPAAPTDTAQNQPIKDGDTMPEGAADAVGAGVGVDIGAEVSTSNDASSASAPMTATVMYSASGYSPSSVTIKKGGTVTWVDQGTGKMWTATAQHPTHTVYAGTTLAEHCDDAKDVSFDQCKNSAQYSFTFDKAGTWRYHNHSQAGHYGSVIVEE